MGDRSNSNSSSDFTFSTVGKVATSVMGESTTRVTDDKVSPEEETAHLFAKSETRYVLRLRILVFLALLCAALAVSLTVYFVTTNAEHQQFEVGLEGYSQKIIESFEDILAVRIGAVANLACTYTEFARDRNLTWPFVTMSDYYQRAGNARDLSDSLFINLYPIVTNETRAAWEEYSVQEKGWLDNGRKYQQKTFELPSGRRLQEQEKAVFVGGNSSSGPSLISNTIMKVGGLRDDSPGPYMPAWQGSPILPFPADAVNFNILYLYSKYMTRAVSSGNIVIGRFLAAPPGGLDSTDGASLFFARVNSYAAGKAVHYEGDPVTSFTVPIFDTMEDNKKPVAALFAAFHWASYLKRLLPPNSQPLTVVIENTCDGPFTFTVQGNNVEYIGHGNLHSTSKSSYVRQTIFNMSAHVRTDAGIDYQLYPNECDISLMVYPTDEMFSFYNTNLPLVITIIIVLIFVFTAVMFLLYDRLVERRQRIVMNTAVKSSQIVSSLFPKQIRDRLFAEEGLDGPVHGTKTKLKSFLSGSGDHNAEGQYIGVKPIADLFLETTILFADIVGFTAWSSVREPSQVFSLLESLFRAFDECASRRRVFKVETVGDCYVAVTGLPDPRKDHALAMVRFARDCLNLMNTVLRELEVTLGPGTADLGLRIGVHSGPVTAGVLRGERSRFQLFGDTMNTAARMESTGKPGQVQLSQETANLLVAAGKENWIRSRDDRVEAKGKGILQTYWLVHTGRSDDDGQSTSGYSDRDMDQPVPKKKSTSAEPAEDITSIDKHHRLVDWTVEILHGLLKQVVARRMCLEATKQQPQQRSSSEVSKSFSNRTPAFIKPQNQMVLDEVCEIITLPKFDAEALKKQVKPESIVLSEAVLSQLHAYVAGIAALYRCNPFHNFEHASHVAMSVVKLLSRIVAPSDLDFQDGREASSTLHDHTYGITSDPLTQFACVMSALIHDADHPGVPNMQLIKENAFLATYYKGKSIAEQNSVDLCWDMLQDERFQELRSTIYTTDSELKRFRQLIVNSVMATDIMDKDLKALRNARWDKAFAESRPDESGTEKQLAAAAADGGSGVLANTNRKATIVIEHLIQASDVAHTMQHWHIYRRWNQRLFEEMFVAYQDGRSDTDPSVNWYKGEMGFFDFYILPLAQKLKDCGVFGVSSDEYMCYAQENRREWESRGQELVAEMVEKAQRKYANRTKAALVDALTPPAPSVVHDLVTELVQRTKHQKSEFRLQQLETDTTPAAAVNVQEEEKEEECGEV